MQVFKVSTYVKNVLANVRELSRAINYTSCKHLNAVIKIKTFT